MFKLIWLQMKMEWTKFIAIILTTIIALSFTIPFVLFGGTVIHQLIRGIETNEDLLAVTSATSGSIIGLSAIFISTLMVQSIKRRQSFIHNLRLNGMTYNSLSKMFLIEITLIMIFAFLISLPVSFGVTKFLVFRFENIRLIDKNFKIEHNPLFYFIALFSVYLIISAVTFIVAIGYRKIQKTQTKIKNHKWKILIGILIFIAMWGGYFGIIIPTRDNIASVQLPLFAIIVSFAFIGKYLWKFLIKILLKITPRTSLTFLSFKSLLSGRSTILQPVFTIFTGVIISSGPIEIPKTLEKSTIQAIRSAYSNISSSISINEVYTKYDSIHSEFESTDKNVFISSFISNSVDILKKYDSEGEMVLREWTAQAVGGNFFLPEVGLYEGEISNFIGSTRKLNSIIVSKSLKAKIGQQIQVSFNNKKNLYSFEVVALFETTPIKNEFFSEIYFNYSDISQIHDIKKGDFDIATIMSDTDHLKTFYNTYSPFSMEGFITIFNKMNTEINVLFGSIFTLLSSIIIANTFVMYVLSNKKGNKVLKILGHTKAQITKIHWIQIVTITGITAFVSWIYIYILNMVNSFLSINHNIIYYYGYWWLPIATTLITFVIVSLSIMIALKKQDKE